jgi:DNA-binding FadR family transcriptional regulator
MDTVKSLKRGGLVELAVEQLTRQIVEGGWPLGARLPGEVQLAEQLEVGRSTVREAIRELVRAGMLESRQGSGTYVISVQPELRWDAVLDAARIVEVYEVRSALEVQAAVLAAGRRTERDIDDIRRALGDRDRLLPTQRSAPAAFVATDLAFHRAVVVAAHNDLLLTMFDSLIPVLTRAMTGVAVADDDLRNGNDLDLPHASLLDAIVARDAAEARRAVESNIHTTIAIFEE